MKRKLAVLAVLLAAAAAWVFWPREGGVPASAAGARAGEALHPQTTASGSGQASAVGEANSAPLDAAEADSPAGTTPRLALPATAADGFIEVSVTAGGKPFAGAEVKLYLRGHADRATGKVDWRLAGAAQTSAAGQARLPARPGSYLVSARAHGFATAHRSVQRPEGEALTKAAIELQAGLAIHGRTLQKGEKEAVPLALVTLVQEDGPPRSGGGGGRRGARSAMFGGPRAPGEAPVEEQLHATSDERGRFRIEGIEPGAYVVTAVATGFAKAVQTVTVPAADEVVLQLSQSSFIEGSVVTSDGKPAAGAAIVASGGRDPVMGVATESGTFAIEVSPRTWELTAKKGEETGRADAPVSVAAGATARGVRIKLGPAASIAGTVVAAASQAPIAGAQIALSPHGADGASGLGQTDANGAFTIGGLAKGSYDAVVSAQGYTDAPYTGLTVNEGQTFPLKAVLHQTGTLQGFVNDSGGHGVPNALVRTLPGFGQPSAQPQEARADANGAYTLSGVAAGHLQLTALRDGSTLGTTATADVAEGGTARVDFQLHDEGTLAGRVRRPDGSLPPAGTTVNAAPSDNRFMRSDWAAIPVDQSGAYVASLPAGAYSLAANTASGGRPGFGNRSFTTVEAGKTAVLDLVYADADDESAGFSGTVLEPGGTPSPGAFVRGISGSGRGGFLFGAMTDENGRFQSGDGREDLPNTFQVVAINGGRTGIAEVSEGEAQATVQLQPGGVINGHLASGPVDQFRVDLTLAQGSPLGGGGPFAAQSLQFTGDRFTLNDVPGTKMHVAVTTQDGRSAAQDVALSPGGEADIEVPLEPLSSVTGRVVDSVTQAPLAGVTIFFDQPRAAGPVSSGTDGSFALQAPSGEHTLRAFAQGYQGLAQSFTAESGAPVALGTVAMVRQKAPPGTIGVSLRGTPPVISFVVPQGPADAAGLHVGDQLVAVDGQPIVSLDDANIRIPGKPGTQVILTVLRSGSTMTMAVTRAPP